MRVLREDADGCVVADVAVPGESDEVGVEEERWDAKRVRASVCCADRPRLMSELGHAMHSVSARAVHAEIATIGRRTRTRWAWRRSSEATGAADGCQIEGGLGGNPNPSREGGGGCQGRAMKTR